jgi:hypothetical protein
MFLQMGLDSPNQVDPVQQIWLCAQMAQPSWSEANPGPNGVVLALHSRQNAFKPSAQ